MIELLNIDCMEYMKTLKDKSFDLAIVDPPYGIGGSRGVGTYSRKWLNYSSENDKRWDKKTPDQSFFTELFRVSNNQIIWGANYMTNFLLPSMGWICWYKTDEVKGRDFSEIELAYSSFDIAARHFQEKPFVRNGTRIHPTQKPIKLYRWLLHNYAQPGQRILDTHGGSRSLAIACHDMGFDHVSCEIDIDYHNDSVKRYNQHIMQQKLFL